ncbi:hypothetical protein ACVW0A_000278 [Pseudomonas sp. TE3610]
MSQFFAAPFAALHGAEPGAAFFPAPFSEAWSLRGR